MIRHGNRVEWGWVLPPPSPILTPQHILIFVSVLDIQRVKICYPVPVPSSGIGYPHFCLVPSLDL